jgi:hypothetical protein
MDYLDPSKVAAADGPGAAITSTSHIASVADTAWEAAASMPGNATESLWSTIYLDSISTLARHSAFNKVFLRV